MQTSTQTKINARPLNGISARQLMPDEWESFRYIRLEALTNEPLKFGIKLADEQIYAEADWRGWLQKPGGAVFGLLSGTNLVGITSVVPWSKDLLEIKSARHWSEKSAFCVAGYIQPAYRGHGLSKLLNETRLDWAARQSQYCHVLLAYRASNLILEKAHAAYGFTVIEKRLYEWPVGARETIVICGMNLDDWRAKHQLPVIKNT